MIKLNGNDNLVLYFFSYETDCIYELPSNKADFENKKSVIPYIVAGLGSTLIGVVTLLTHILSGAVKHYISLAVPFAFLVVLAFALHSTHTAEKREEEHVLKNGRCREDFSAEKAYRIARDNNKLFLKVGIFYFLGFVLCAGFFVTYIIDQGKGIKATLAAAGTAISFSLLVQFKPIQRVRLLLHLKRKAQQER